MGAYAVVFSEKRRQLGVPGFEPAKRASPQRRLRNWGASTLGRRAKAPEVVTRNRTIPIIWEEMYLVRHEIDRVPHAAAPSLYRDSSVRFLIGASALDTGMLVFGAAANRPHSGLI